MTTIEELREVAFKISDYGYIAGGFYKNILRGEEPKDIDVFMYSKEGYDELKQILMKHENSEAIEEKVSVAIGRFQIVKPVVIAERMLYGKPLELIPTFDINIARVWIDGFTGEVCSIEDLEELNFQIEQKWFEATIFHDDEERTFERMERYEKSYGYTCVGTTKQE